MSWENVVANPGTSDRTVVVGLDDSTPGQVYVYVGEKRRSGNPVERAGLVGGTLFGVKAVGYPVEPAEGIPSGTPFELVEIENAQKTGAAIDSESRALGVTDFNRPEDGAWDPSRRDKFYWVTTGRPKVSGGNSRLWRFDFTNARKPEQGGTIDMLLDGSEGQEMMDNMTVDGYGRVLINEDPGNNPIASRIWSYEIRSDRLVEVAVQKQAHGPEPNPAYTGYNTNDEEVSGIIPADDILGKGWYLLDSQIHNSAFSTTSDAQKLVEKGQLLALYHPVGRDKDEDD
ncbi:MAG: alkaline phosphatase PhoX [Gaiellaceae bacterium]